MSPTHEDRDDTTGRAAKAAAILGAVFTLAALGLYGGRAAFSVSIGSAVAVANLLTMRAIIRALIRPPDESVDSNSDGKPEQKSGAHGEAGRRGGVAWGVFAVLKIFILFGGLWILLTRHVVDPIPLVVGYGVLPLGITLSALWPSLRSPHD